MADDQEKVIYEFQGDVSSLRDATTDALDLLGKFQDTMNRLNSDGIVKASQRAQTGFQSSINKMTKSITDIQKKLNTVGDIRMPRGTEAFDTTKSATDTLADTLAKLESSNTVTTKSLNELKTGLNNVTAGLKSSGPAYDALIAKEEKFQQRLATIENVANKVSSGIQGATNKVKGTFNSMGAFIGAKLGAIGAKFEPLVAKLQGFKDRAVIAGNRVAQVFTTVAAAFRRTSDGTEGASASQSKLGRALDSIREKLSSHQKELKRTATYYEDMEDTAEDAYQSMSSGAMALSGPLNIVQGLVNGLLDTFFALAGVETGNLFAEGAESAIDYVENMNLFSVAMGSSIDKGKAFVNQMQELYGMDPSNIYRYAGYFYQLTDAIGMSEEASASVSLSMTKAANDIASLFNEDIQTVVDNLASGMQGMSRAVRKYGMDIRATTLQQTAYKYGLEEEVENMSEANRQALRYITMLEQTQNALNQTTTAADGTTVSLGDFARNIETPANQLRIFKEQMSQLGRAVGTFIVAPLAKALPFINGFVMALRTLINFIASLLGVSVEAGSSLSSVGDSASDAADGVGSIGDAAGKASKKLKQLIAPFDELNVLQESTDDGSGGGGGGWGSDVLDPALAEALASMELDLDNIKMKANQVRDSILEFLGIKVTTDPITGEQIIQWDKDALLANIITGLDNLKNWFSDLSPFAQFALTFAAVATAISTVGTIAGAIPAVLGVLSTAFAVLTSPITLVSLALSGLLVYSESFREQFVALLLGVGQSVGEWGKILADVFVTVGKDIAKMWKTHFEPTIKAIGDALAPALETLGSLWKNLSKIVSDIFAKIGNLWSTVLKPIIEGAMEIIQDLANKFKMLWEEYVGPVVEHIGNGLEELWTNTFSPVIDNIISLLGEFWEMVMALWKNVLSPLIDWLINTLGPAFESVFKGVWNVIQPIIANIGEAVGGVVDIFGGVIKFLTGVFTGDWKKAWEGIKSIFKGIWDTFAGIVKVPINLIIGLINGMINAVEKGLNWIIDGINKISFNVPDWVPGIGGKKFGFSLKQVNWGNISYLAKGGVVTGPTPAMIGEGKYSEAVIPLDDSPQMNDLINKIVDAINKDDPNPQPVEVKVYIGDSEYDAYTYKASERGKKIVGKQPIKIGG